MILQTPSKYFVATSQVLPPILVILFSLISLYALFFSSLFNITQVKCYQDFNESCQNSYVLAEANKSLSENLFLLDESELGGRIMRGDPTIRTIDYKKVLPGTLILQIQTVYPTLALGIEGNSSLLILDADFRIIKSTDADPNVPIVRYHKPLSLRIGERIGDDALRSQLSACLKIVGNIPGSKNCLVEDSALTVLLEDDKTNAIFTTQRNLDEQLSALHTIRSGVTISGSKPVIDVRYQQPIIKGNN
ncbi:MAG: hypothetical protein Fur0011_5440 [Candidatus Microgenomates bacterium]